MRPPKGEMRIEYVDLARLLKWPGNPKEHDQAALAESMDENGFVDPLLLDEGSGRLVKGHGRLEQLERRKAAGAPPPGRVMAVGGCWFVPVVRGVKFEDLDHAERYLLADNRITELGGWDNRALAALLSKRGDDPEALFGTGFDSEDVVKFMAMTAGPAAPTSFPAVGANLAVEFCCPKCQYRWSGNPMAGAPRPGDEEIDAEPEETPARGRAARK